MNRLKRMSMAVLAVIIAGACALPAAQVGAISSSALSITPKKNYLIEPGKSTKDTLVIHNLDTSNELDLTLRVVDFTYTDNGGTPKLFIDPNAPQTTWSLKPFLTIPETAVVPAGATKTLNMSVAIPAGHGAGSYYSAIVYSSGSGQGGNVGLSASGVTLVFAQIPGKVNENLTLQKFGAYDPTANGADSGYINFSMKEPFNMGYTIKNNGNVTEAPVGTITLKYMFGQQIAINNVNPAGSLALIGQRRTFTTCIKLQDQTVKLNGSATTAPNCVSPGLWPGLYTANLDMFYGQNGNETQEFTGTTWFWYIPAWFIIVLFFVILIIAYIVWRIVRKIKGTQSRRIKLNKSIRRK